VLNSIQNEINGYDFENDGTDYSILNKTPAASMSMMEEYIFSPLPDNSPWRGGQLIDLSSSNVEFAETCGLALTDYLGPLLSQGVCFTTDWFKEIGAMFWIQLLLDVGVIFACISAVLNNFRKLVYLFTGVNLSMASGDAKVFVNAIMPDTKPNKK
jgi:hypothetical protein